MAKYTPNFTIKQWEAADRPREKLIQKGSDYLSNAELLAILIGSGNRGESAVRLMQRMMSQYGNSLSELQKSSINKIMDYKGIGQAKAVKIKVALELSKRIIERHSKELVKFTISINVFNIMIPILARLPYEEFWILYLNRSNGLVDKSCLSKGGTSQTVVDVRLAMKKALELGATGMILVHNHPSGNLQPSKQDKNITRKLINAAATFDILVLDHLIISEKGYYSFKDESII
jgi:DNA repair protein RadC